MARVVATVSYRYSIFSWWGQKWTRIKKKIYRKQFPGWIDSFQSHPEIRNRSSSFGVDYIATLKAKVPLFIINIHMATYLKGNIEQHSKEAAVAKLLYDPLPNQRWWNFQRKMSGQGMENNTLDFSGIMMA